MAPARSPPDRQSAALFAPLAPYSAHRGSDRGNRPSFHWRLSTRSAKSADRQSPTRFEMDGAAPHHVGNQAVVALVVLPNLDTLSRNRTIEPSRHATRNKRDLIGQHPPHRPIFILSDALVTERVVGDPMIAARAQSPSAHRHLGSAGASTQIDLVAQDTAPLRMRLDEIGPNGNGGCWAI